MLLSPGTRLGPYEILTTLGAGGMGEVYRARDAKLGREVALKVLPEIFAADCDRLMRFEREARTLASLNHPSIAQVYEIEDSTETRALVMELVQGEDLSARIARGPMPVDEALAISRQIADALEAAHSAGIVHRDLKPATSLPGRPRPSLRPPRHYHDEARGTDRRLPVSRRRRPPMEGWRLPPAAQVGTSWHSRDNARARRGGIVGFGSKGRSSGPISRTVLPGWPCFRQDWGREYATHVELGPHRGGFAHDPES